ncbi:SDR family oxidoreductase [Pseudonocardia eucalypti]|uniref:SDR family oxidoreductase n=1 Tax=Pseudonocardia eucalypti TaxID=648755 RepID=A0ABP9QGI1_9PSEU|nr:NAD(P)-dependent dehydrogenase (short-subunit alcohol dehydrogenase family) [Pseudonocardia eucalypti]
MFDGRKVLITGGGTGIGAAAAARFRAEGARVAVLGRRPAPLDEVAARTGALPLVADAADRAAIEDAVRTVVARYGGLDVVVANAGGHGLSAVGDTDDADWEQSLRSNLTSAFATVRAALPELVKSRGSVVVVSSLAGLFAGPSVAGYTVGKHALIGLTRSLARDYGRHGVRVNAVCPGWVCTPMADEQMDALSAAAGLADREAAYRRVTENVPLGRPARPEEIAAIIRFLASDDSSYITGSVTVADGGAHAVDLPTIALATT